MYFTSVGHVDPAKDKLLATFAVPQLAPGASTTVAVPVTLLPLSIKLKGTYTLGPALDATAVAAEHSEANNVNPFLAGSHGNVKVTVP